MKPVELFSKKRENAWALETDLTQKKCKPCEGGIAALDETTVRRLLKNLQNWTLVQNRIEKELKFSDFVNAMKFVNKIADIAESEGHHPDLHIHYNRVRIVLWTHGVGGLTENDFIVAAKIDAQK